MSSHFKHKADSRYLSFNRIFRHRSLVKRFVGFFSSFFANNSYWGSYNFDSFDFENVSLRNLFSLLVIIISEASFLTFTCGSIFTKFNLFSKEISFPHLFSFLDHFLSHRLFFSSVSLNVDHVGLSSSAHVFYTRRLIYLRKRADNLDIKLPLCTNLLETKFSKNLIRKYLYKR